jgi:hypothetical protein
MKKYLHIGGLIAVGFDPNGSYLLTVTHSGRGVFSTTTWERIARDYSVVYPDGDSSIGIGPLAEQTILVTEMNYQTGAMHLKSPDGAITLHCESGGITVEFPDSQA